MNVLPTGPRVVVSTAETTPDSRERAAEWFNTARPRDIYRRGGREPEQGDINPYQHVVDGGVERNAAHQ
jgi:hypothetical protein